ANFFGGVLVFPTLAAFNASAPDLFLKAFGDPHTNYGTVPLGFWINDHWEARSGLSFEAGLRFDRQAMPAGLPSSSSNVAPRLGMAWRPGTLPFVLRAGFGLFYDRYPLAYLNNAIQFDGTHGYITLGADPL